MMNAGRTTNTYSSYVAGGTLTLTGTFDQDGIDPLIEALVIFKRILTITNPPETEEAMPL